MAGAQTPASYAEAPVLRVLGAATARLACVSGGIALNCDTGAPSPAAASRNEASRARPLQRLPWKSDSAKQQDSLSEIDVSRPYQERIAVMGAPGETATRFWTAFAGEPKAMFDDWNRASAVCRPA